MKELFEFLAQNHAHIKIVPYEDGSVIIDVYLNKNGYFWWSKFYKDGVTDENCIELMHALPSYVPFQLT